MATPETSRNQWPFQEPQFHVATIYIYIQIYLAYFQAYVKEDPHTMARNMVLTYLHSGILKISHWRNDVLG